jgi:hypothetical protein
MVKFFGIRHHGPGSANSLKNALFTWKPDCILVETPEEMDQTFKFFSSPGMTLPIACLLYAKNDPSKASYLPMAVFSPEYQAIVHSQQFQIPIRAIDLPMAYQFVREQNLPTLNLSARANDWEIDPLGKMAQLAGYSDYERWWEVTFEEQEGSTAIFDAIANMMETLRPNGVQEVNGMNIWREAWMRKQIRKAIKEGFEKIAVVCGAWHVPRLQEYHSIKEKDDQSILKGRKKEPCTACLIPWSYEQMTPSQGYNSGVHAPFWYESLFFHPKQAVVRWMVKAARLLRRKNLDASSAEVMEAVGLANALAGLRNLKIPGLKELEDAALTVLCQGKQAQLDAIYKNLLTNNRVGKIPKEAPQIPIQKDFLKTVKSLRLSSSMENDQIHRKELDLRKPNQLQVSIFLHRLLLLEIEWGRKLTSKALAQGSFNERWSLKWHPRILIQIIQCGRWGKTIEEALLNKINHKIEAAKDPVRLAKMLDHVIKADLKEVVQPLLRKLQETGVGQRDTESQMQVLNELIPLRRYGDVRNVDQNVLDWLIDDLITRICLGIQPFVFQMNEEEADQFFSTIQITHHLIGFLEHSDDQVKWLNALKGVLEQKESAPKIRGGILRILYDKGIISLERTQKYFVLELSQRDELEKIGRWLEGFLFGSAGLLLYQPSLLMLLDDWISRLDQNRFMEVLPILRRTFSKYSGNEKQRIMRKVLLQEKNDKDQEMEWDQKRLKMILPQIQSWFS